jgi:hypothetical protein
LIIFDLKFSKAFSTIRFMRFILQLIVGSLISTNLIFANEPVPESTLQKNELSHSKETKELNTKPKLVKKKKSKMTSENTNPKNGEQEDAPPAPPVY